MPTSVRRRGGQFPVRLSLNISEAMSQRLDRWERATGEPRGNLARRALEYGMPKLRYFFSERIQNELAGEAPNTSYRPRRLPADDQLDLPGAASEPAGSSD